MRISDWSSDVCSSDLFRIAVAETYDVIVEPATEEAYTIFAQSMDRTGYARGTLAVAEGLSAPVPETDPRPLITMDDMGLDHASMGGLPGMDHGGYMGAMDHSTMSGRNHGADRESVGVEKSVYVSV